METKKIKGMDILGNIAILKFPKKIKAGEKRKLAYKILKQHKSITTILEKISKFKGRLRKQKTKHLAGEKTKEVLYKENNCIFRFNVDSCYFSPRLSTERKEIASKIKKNEKVLVMFAGVAPYSIVIAKNSKAKKVVSNEINREANKYAKLNVELNKVKEKVELVFGDVKKIAERLSHHPLPQPPALRNDVNSKKDFGFHIKTHTNKRALVSHLKNQVGDNERAIKRGVNVRGTLVPLKFDVIIMPRPQLRESFLKEAFMLSKKNTRVYYYDFCKSDEINSVVEKIQKQAKKFRKKIKILNTKTAGEIAPYKFRVRVDFEVV